MGFFKEFKDFAVKGNVMDMAVGVVVGTAFTGIVNSLVKDIMTKTPKTVPADTKITDIEDLLREYKIHSVLVTDEDGKLLGVVDSFSTMI